MNKLAMTLLFVVFQNSFAEERGYEYTILNIGDDQRAVALMQIEELEERFRGMTIEAANKELEKLVLERGAKVREELLLDFRHFSPEDASEQLDVFKSKFLPGLSKGAQKKVKKILKSRAYENDPTARLIAVYESVEVAQFNRTFLESIKKAGGIQAFLQNARTATASYSPLPAPGQEIGVNLAATIVVVAIVLGVVLIAA